MKKFLSLLVLGAVLMVAHPMLPNLSPDANMAKAGGDADEVLGTNGSHRGVGAILPQEAMIGFVFLGIAA